LYNSNNSDLDFKLLFESAPGLYLILLPDSPRFSIVGASDNYLLTTLTKRNLIVGRGLFEVFPDNPLDPAATGVANLTASLNRVMAGMKPDQMQIQKYDIPLPNTGGKEFEQRYWSAANTPVFDHGGRIKYIIHQVEDVTDLINMKQREKLSEITLLESYERFDFILKTAHDSFVGMNSLGLVTDWNPQAERTFGWKRDEAVGRSLSELIIPPAYRAAHERGLKHFMASGEGPVLGKRLELKAVHKAGHEFPVEITISAIKLGTDFFFSAFLRDISEKSRS
jgi:PAS domain S-box-containing protein